MFQEYEETLASILENVKQWEPEIAEQLETPVASLDEVNTELDNVRGIHNRLQNEKSRLVTAIQACEAATACISRPTTPLEDASSLRDP